jgi:hypothetical protein
MRRKSQAKIISGLRECKFEVIDFDIVSLLPVAFRVGFPGRG